MDPDGVMSCGYSHAFEALKQGRTDGSSGKHPSAALRGSPPPPRGTFASRPL